MGRMVTCLVRGKGGIMIRAVLRAAAAATMVVCALAPLVAVAQAWPTKPVKFVVPFPPGGSVDPLARMLGVRLADALGQPFIVENKTGASGSIGTAFVAKSAPDGSTYVVVVATAKARPEALSIGSVGNGSLGHLAMIVVQQQGGFKVTHVPYKGGGPMMADVMGKQIDLGIASTAALSANVKGGKLHALAVTGETRSGVMPNVPTLAEQGFTGFSAYAWWGILAPAGTPKPVIDKFHAELAKALGQPDLRKQLTETLGMDLQVSSPEALQKFVAGEIDRWGKVVRSNNVKAD